MGGRRRHRRLALGARVRRQRRRDRLDRRGGQLTPTEDPEELVGHAADELYGLPPEDFTTARDERVRAARSAGDRALAAKIGRLRRPTVSAWVLNLLARDQPEVGEQLVELGAELRRAQEELSGPALRQLAGQRQQLVAALVRSARQIAARHGHRVSQATAYELEQTLHAALADPDVAAEIGSGRLARAESRTGFDAAPPEPKATPVRRLRIVRDTDEKSGDTESRAAARERQRREQERERLREEAEEAERARAEAAEALAAVEDELVAAERVRAGAAEAVEELRGRLAEAEDTERDALRSERDAQRARDTAARRRDSTTRKAGDLAARLADLS